MSNKIGSLGFLGSRYRGELIDFVRPSFLKE